MRVFGIQSVAVFAIVTGCAAAPSDGETSELREFLMGTTSAAGDAAYLNELFSRRAVRASGYRDAGVEAPVDERWSPVAVMEGDEPVPAGVEAWLQAGDIAESGSFEPCVTPCPSVPARSIEDEAALEARLTAAGVDARVDRVAGAALRLTAPDYQLRWVSASDYAIVIDHEHRLITLNAGLVALLAPQREGANGMVFEGGPVSGEPSTSGNLTQDEPEAPSSGRLLESDTDTTAKPLVLRSHEPPEDYQASGGGCDLFDDVDCTGSDNGDSSSCAITRRPRKPAQAGGRWVLPVLPLFFGMAAGVFWLRRRLRRGSRLGRFSSWFLFSSVLLLSLSAPRVAAAQDAADTSAPAGEQAAATLRVQGFAPDAVIAIDGQAVARGQWSGPVAPGQHLVQVYKPDGPAYDFPIEARAGETIDVPPASAAPPPPPPPPPAPIAEPPPPPPPPAKRRFVRGPWVLAHVGFAALTATPEGFSYERTVDPDTGETSTTGGLSLVAGASGGIRLTRGVGIGGLLMYTRGGGNGTVSQVVGDSTTGFIHHEGPADFTAQSVRLGPHFRFMAGGDRARFLASTNLGVAYNFIDLEHVDLIAQGGNAIETGTFHHDYDGWSPFFGFDLGAEFNPGDHLLLGVAFDAMIDMTSSISGNPYGGTSQGYVGFSFRIGYHLWQAQ